MTSRMTQGDIRALKARVPLASLIGRSVALRRDGPGEFTALCPFHTEETPSFRVYADHAHCFGCGWHGDALDWLRERERMSFPGAIRHLREWSGAAEPVEREIERAGGDDYGWTPLLPVPSDAPTLVDGRGIVRAFNPKRQGTSWEWTRWRPTLVHPYRLAAGALAGYVLRVDMAKGGKFTPFLTFCRHKTSGERRWCVISLPAPRPLYRLDELQQRPSATVLLVEGEKTADAAQRLLPSLVAMTWPGGAKAYHLADFAPLRARKVIGLPDADAEGRAAFDGRAGRRGKRIPGVLEILAGIGADIRRVEPQAEPAGWDLADAEAEGWDAARALAWLKSNMVRPGHVAR